MANELIGSSEHQVALAVHSMERRSDLLGGHYPFQIAEDHLRVSKSAPDFPYTALLSMTASSPIGQLVVSTASEFELLAVQFEKVTEVAVRCLLGPGSRALRFGYPNDLGRPSDFQEAMVWLAGQLEVKLGEQHRPPRRKDGGVDVIGWRPFPDNKAGMPLVLVQCTLQRDFAHKAADIDLRHWSGWLDLPTPPTTVLAIPGHVTAHSKWDEITARSMILDRIRLAGLIGAPAESDAVDGVKEATWHRIEQVGARMDEATW